MPRHHWRELTTLQRHKSARTGGGTTTENQKPEHKIGVGAVSASIWKRSRTIRDGRSFDARHVILDRTYKDSEGNWKNVNSYDANDIPKAILALEEAYAYVVKRPDDRDVVAVEDVN